MLKEILQNYSTTTLIAGAVLVFILFALGKKLLSFLLIGAIIGLAVYYFI